MAIQTRKGPKSDFDPNKMLPGEWAGTTDTKEVFYAFDSGDVKKMATYEDMQENIGSVTQDIINNLTEGVDQVIDQATTVIEVANKSTESAQQSTQAADKATEDALEAAEQAMNATKSALGAAGQIEDKLSKEDLIEGDNIKIEIEEKKVKISSTGSIDINTLINKIYPVGSIYMSVNPTNPSELFGGTWVTWGSGKVPVGVNTNDTNFNTVEKEGGASSVALTTNEMPTHTHTFTGTSVNTSSQSSSTTGNESKAHTHSTYYYASSSEQGTNKNAFNMTIWTNKYSIAGDNMETESVTHNHNYAHTHTLTAKGTNSNTGSGKEHNNLQPYITCYMWKRTA